MYRRKNGRSPYYNSRYRKPYFFPGDQIQKLESRGLVIPDKDEAKTFIRTCGYFRFSGYAYYFKRGKVFVPGTNFKQIQRLYEFDDALRNKLVEGLEKIELALRFHVSNRLGFYHPFAHRMSHFLRPECSRWKAHPGYIEVPAHLAWLEKYSSEERRSQGDFVKHFRRKYGPHLPVWAATEIMTFGLLNQLFKQIPMEDCKLIAARMGIIDIRGGGDSGVLSNWIEHFRYLRNCCAHHARVWNRVFDRSLSSPSTTALPELSNFSNYPHKLYKTIMAMTFVLARIESDSTWHEEILSLIKSFTQENRIPLEDMGFPVNWEAQEIWKPLSPNALEVCRAADYVSELNCIHQAQLLKSFSPDRITKQRKELLRYLCKKNALFFHQIGDAKYYPLFQFTKDKVTVNSEVADVNEVLLTKLSSQDSQHPEQAAQDWWLSPDLRNGFSDSPLQEIAENPGLVLSAAKAYRWDAKK